MPGASSPHGESVRLLGWAGLFSAVLLAPSWWKWLHEPQRFIEFEFDFWLGALGPELPVILGGRAIFSCVMLALGLVYLRLLWLGKRFPALCNPWLLAFWAALLYTTGLPFVSPDVFYYLGKGWHAVHYGADVFSKPISTVNGYADDELFSNIFPGFLHQWGNYGPYFQWLCMGVVWPSGGHLVPALLLFKVVCLACHLGCLGALAVLARRLKQPPGWVVMAYGANPLVLVSLMTANHNEVIMMLPLLWAVVAVLDGRRWTAGLLWSLAFGIKLMPILVLPAFVVYCFKSGRRWTQGIINVGIFLSGALLAGLGGFALFPGSWAGVVWLFQATPIPVLRSSSYLALAIVGNFFNLGEEAWAYVVGGGKLLFAAYWAAVFAFATTSSGPLRAKRFSEWLMGAMVGYLLVVSIYVTEWYLVWFLGLAAAAGGRHARFSAVLSAAYMPLVIWMVKVPGVLQIASQLVAWMVLAGCAWVWAKPRLKARSRLARRFGSTVFREAH